MSDLIVELTPRHVLRGSKKFWGGAVLLGFAAVSIAQPSVRSYAAGETVDTVFETTTPGVAVRSSVSISSDVLSYFGGELVTTISASSSARAETNFGVNRIYASGATTTFIGPDSFGLDVKGNVWTATSASSDWRDVWRLSGDLGTFAPVTVSGTLTGSIVMTEPDLALRFSDGDPIALGVSFYADFGIASPTGGPAPIVNLTGKDFADAREPDGTFTIPWSISGLAARGYSANVQAFFSADARGGNLACRTLAVASCQSPVTFASFSTAQIDRIIIPDGDTLTAESGALVVRDGYVTYAASIPEPGTYGLMALGVLAIAARVARRRDCSSK